MQFFALAVNLTDVPGTTVVAGGEILTGAGRLYSVTVRVPLITAAQNAPATVFAVYVPALKVPLNVAGFPLPFIVAPGIALLFLYN
jgi:hypothetical protein